jgi:hypothetical protein
MNKKYEVLKQDGSKEREKKTNVICKTYLSSCYFFIIHFPLDFKDDF